MEIADHKKMNNGAIKSKQPLVSIVIPCYQQERLLSRALRSIDCQTYQNIEIIVVDDGSQPEICIKQELYKRSINVIRQENEGLSSARNKGLGAAKGEFVKFLDADDEIFPDCISMQIENISHHNFMIGCIGFREIDEDSGTEIDIIPAFSDALHALLMINIGPPHIYFFRTDSVRHFNGFSCGAHVWGGHEDYDLLLRMVMSGYRLVTVHDIGVIYYRREGSMSTIKDKMDRTRADVWGLNVLNYLMKNENISISTMVAVLSALCNIMNITPEKYKSNLYPVIGEIEKKLKRVNLELGEDIMQQLVSNLRKQRKCESLADAVLKQAHINTRLDIIRPQSIIDHRLYLRLAYNNFGDDYLKSVLVFARKHKGRFSIYGAGEIGRRLFGILTAAGLFPVAIFDKNWDNIIDFDGFLIKDPESISVKNTPAIIIASKAYRDEIICYIKSLNPVIDLI